MNLGVVNDGIGALQSLAQWPGLWHLKQVNWALYPAALWGNPAG